MASLNNIRAGRAPAVVASLLAPATVPDGDNSKHALIARQ